MRRSQLTVLLPAMLLVALPPLLLGGDEEAASLEKKVAQAEADETAAKKAVESTREQVEALKDTLSKLDEDLKWAQDALNSAEQKLKKQQELAERAAAEKEAALRKLVEQAQARRDATQAVVGGIEQKAKDASAELSKLKNGLGEAQDNLKKAQEELDAQKEAASKAAEEQAKIDKAAEAAAKVAQEAEQAAKAALERAKQAAVKAKTARKEAEAAAKKTTEAQTAVVKTEKQVASTKQTIEELPQKIEQADANLAGAKTELRAAEAQLAAVSAETLERRKALEAALISSGKLVSFAEQVAPILASRCLACHSARIAKGRLNMETFAGLMKGGESGAVIEPGEGDFSTLYLMVEDGTMPKEADPLTADQLATIRKWIDSGASLDAGMDESAPLITIMPKPDQPLPPESYRAPVPITALAFSPDGTQLASSGYHEVLLYSTADGSLSRRIRNVAERVYDLQYSSDGHWLAVAAGTPGQMGEAKLFNMADGQLLADFVTAGDSMFAVALSPDGKRIASAGADRAIRVCATDTGEVQLLVEDHADWVMDLAWSPDGTKLASASRDKTSKVFDATTGESLVTFNGHGEPVFGVGFTPDGNQVVTGGRDKQIRIWNVSDAKQVREIKGFGDEVFRIAVTEDGRVFSSSADKMARLHAIADGKTVQTFSGHNDWVYSIAYSPATTRVATGSYDGEIRLWNVEDGSQRQSWVAAPGYQSPETTASAEK